MASIYLWWDDNDEEYKASFSKPDVANFVSIIYEEGYRPDLFLNDKEDVEIGVEN